MCTHVVCVPRGDHLFSSFVVLDHFGWMDDDDVSVREGERERSIRPIGIGVHSGAVYLMTVYCVDAF